MAHVLRNLLAIFALQYSYGAMSAIISLRETPLSDSLVDVFVSFAAGTENTIKDFAKNVPNSASRGERLAKLKLALQENARRSQQEVVEFLTMNPATRDLPITQFWISNQLFIKGANMQLIQELSMFKDIVKISEEDDYTIDAPTDSKIGDKPANDDIQWGILKVQAPNAWKLGYNGEGILVGTIDTGVHLNHEALKSNYIGNYGWFDPYKGTESPRDESGHGTHTIATIVGSHGVGVAPGAKWMTCRGCYKGFCTVPSLLTCGQFLLCPTDAKGQNEDCSRAPHIISNSFGGGQGRDTLWPIFNAWVAAEIIIVFSNGNSGPFCGTANSHADSPQVIGVGGTTVTDSIYIRSSVGPSVYGTLKPDLAAPGVDILSAYHTADDAYHVMSGTSMAAPHVAGAVAILKSANADLSTDNIKLLLSEGCEKSLEPTGRNCGGIPENTFPNHSYGRGRIDVHRSLLYLLKIANHTVT